MTQHSRVIDDICLVGSTRVKKELGGTTPLRRVIVIIISLTIPLVECYGVI